MRLVRAALILGLVGGVAWAAPPPPAFYPKDLPQQVGGYELQQVYSVYHRWIGRGRKEALSKAVPHEQQWRGKHHWGSVAASELIHYDFDVLRLDRYCSGDWLDNEPEGNCELRYRYAFVPGSVYSDEKRDQLIRESFRPEDLTSLFARQGWKPSDPNGLWSDSRLIHLFEQHTELASFYRPLVEAHDVAAADCPALRQAVEEFDVLTVTIDPERQGKPAEVAPHGQQTLIRLSATTPDGGQVTIEGSDPLYKLLQPIWHAAEACSPPSYAKKEGAS